MKLNSKINPDLEVNQILLERDFLRLLKVYFKGQALNKLDFSEKTQIFIEDFKKLDLENKSIDFSVEEMFKNLGLIFSNSEALGKFLFF